MQYCRSVKKPIKLLLCGSLPNKEFVGWVPNSMAVHQAVPQQHKSIHWSFSRSTPKENFLKTSSHTTVFILAEKGREGVSFIYLFFPVIAVNLPSY